MTGTRPPQLRLPRPDDPDDPDDLDAVPGEADELPDGPARRKRRVPRKVTLALAAAGGAGLELRTGLAVAGPGAEGAAIGWAMLAAALFGLTELARRGLRRPEEPEEPERARPAWAAGGGDPYAWLPPGPWLMRVRSLSGRALSGHAAAVAGEQPGAPVTVLRVTSRDSLIRRIEAIRQDSDLRFDVFTAQGQPQDQRPPQPPPPLSPGSHRGQDDDAAAAGSGVYTLGPPPGGPPTDPRVKVGPLGDAGFRRSGRLSIAVSTISPAWNAIVAEIGDADISTDEQFLDWSREQLLGLAAYGQQINDFYEHMVSVEGIDPEAIWGLAEFGEAVIEAAGHMANVRRRFAEHYKLHRLAAAEAAASGKSVPVHVADWTGGGGEDLDEA